MCGIAGIANTHNRPVDKRVLDAMSRAIFHRGPDDSGEFLDGPVALASRRLSIIDLAAGKQPISNEDGSIVIVYNGETYNYQELRTQLQAEGHVFATHTDTETIVHLYEKMGPDCLSRLNGMYAFALWDGRQRRLMLARDRFGIKPLYYTWDGERLAFASEIKAFCKLPGFKVESEPAALVDYAVFQYSPGEHTFFKGVKKLLPGHFLLFEPDTGDLQVRRYWDLPCSDDLLDFSHDEDYFAEKLLLIIEDAVRIQLRSDVPVGSHLSGGLDSSSVASLAANLLGTSIHTFSGGFREGEAYDETSYARIVATAIGSEHHEIWPIAEDFARCMPSLIYYMDEPAAGPGLFPQYFVSKLAASQVKVVLGGQGGDELGAGYARYLVCLLERALRDAVSEAEDWVSNFTLSELIPSLGQLRHYAPMLQSFLGSNLFGPDGSRYYALVRRGDPSRLLTPEALAAAGGYDPTDTYREIFTRPDTTSYLNRMLYFDAMAMLPALLHVEDRTSMAVSIESRVPLLDHRIAELFATIPDKLKLKGGELKYIYRRAMKNTVPPAIMQRKDKMGFPVPTADWFKGPLKDWLHDLLLSERALSRGVVRKEAVAGALAGDAAYGRELWGLLCLELWFRAFVDGETPTLEGVK
ncbi:MAG: asparagine synthase (glutamine-hydrolyzing) [Chloroflexia bacterium]